jgi:Chorismatase FkbO/Hyg5-like, N-terminal
MASIPQAPTRIIVGEGDLKPPLWVEDLLAGAPPEALPVAIESGQAWTRSGDGFGLTSVQFKGAEGMDILTFQQAVADAYRTVLEQLRSDHAVRFWAFVPRIHAEYGHGLDRYMAFNAGRFAAFSAWLGGREAFSRSMPTASAVGSRTPDFALHCLASRWPGQPVENPRQIPAYEYSKRFGPLPPCFARATLLRRKPFHEDLLLVGGTASIVGEDSQHPGVVVLQARETFRNLASLVCSAAQGAAGPLPESDSEVAVSLARFKEVRAYYRETRHSQQVRDLVQAAFSAAARIETFPAELCRPELLVEIEGVARLPAKS